MSKEPGYVYILTNPSFKEDWVKIGKSSRPVDIRSRELDNTAVPLPFEIYATLQTSKYNEVEKLVHKTIDRLTDLRIRQNREFFNVRPDVALDILRDIASTLEDARINSYNHGDVVHVVPGEANRDTDKTTATQKMKNEFWRGYNEVMERETRFTSQFTLHSIPRYSYDLRLGTSTCNIYQVAKTKKLSIGLYFHGKEQFRSFQCFRKEFNAILGLESDWTEFDKDCTIGISRDFNLEDKSSYDEAYRWLLDKALKFKDAFARISELATIADTTNIPNNNGEDIIDNPSSERGSNRPPFRFSMVGIAIGEELIFTPTGIKVRVASDNQIEYEGRLYKLSPFTGTFMPEEKRNTSGAYQGTKFFTYKGEVLDDIRRRIEKE